MFGPHEIEGVFREGTKFLSPGIGAGQTAILY